MNGTHVLIDKNGEIQHEGLRSKGYTTHKPKNGNQKQTVPPPGNLQRMPQRPVNYSWCKTHQQKLSAVMREANMNSTEAEKAMDMIARFTGEGYEEMRMLQQGKHISEIDPEQLRYMTGKDYASTYD